MLWPVTFSCCTKYLPQFIGQSLLDHTQQSRVGCSCKGTNIPTSLISPLIFPGTMCLINISTSLGKENSASSGPISLVANYVKIEAMGSVWDLKLKLTFEWKTYGHIFFIVMDILLDLHSLWIGYGIRTLHGKAGVISCPQIFHRNGGM